MSTVYCIGEVLIDFFCLDSKNENFKEEVFLKKPGGAPANVASVISKFGANSSFLGKVGNDSFGMYLKKVLDTNKVSTKNLQMEGNTTLAFVSVSEDGERDFTFMRNSDGNYKISEKDLCNVKKDDIVHFGSATALIESSLKKSYFKLLEYCINKNIFISFDPNYRDTLIKDKENFIKDALKFISVADFVKLSLEEAYLISNKTSLEESIKYFINCGAKRVAITLGKEGTVYADKNNLNKIKTINVKSIDSTGAGDGFVGAVLYKIATSDINLLDENIQDYMFFANVTGALICTKYGALSSIPNKEEVEKYI